MKLIDILIRDLPGRGGWPVGVHNITQYDSGELCFNRRDGSCMNASPSIYLLPHEDGVATDWAFGVRVTQEEYEAALAAGKEMLINKPQPVWNGEYPIPPGTDVAVHFEGDDSRVWTDFRVEYMRGDVVVLFDHRNEDVASYSNKRLNFRPIRTEAERKREDAETALRTCLAGSGAGVTPLAATKIYDAIATGKIPGVKLS